MSPLAGSTDGRDPDPVVVGLALVLDGDRVLLTRRRPGEHLEGLWEFPGGKVREGEGAAAAARRELLEETGMNLPVERFEPLTFVHHDYGDRRVLLLAFTASLEPHAPRAGAAPSGGELARERKWITRRELSSTTMPAANARIVARLLELRRPPAVQLAAGE